MMPICLETHGCPAANRCQEMHAMLIAIMMQRQGCLGDSSTSSVLMAEQQNSQGSIVGHCPSQCL